METNISRGGSWNEWSQLRAVVVGTTEDFLPHVWSWDMSPGVEERLVRAIDLAQGAIPDWYISEVEEDLCDFVALLKSFDVVVHRPISPEKVPFRVTSAYASAGVDYYNMRDMQFVFGQSLFNCQPPNPARVGEHERLQQFFSDVTRTYGLQQVTLGRPSLKADPRRPLIRDSHGLHEYEESRHEALGGFPEDIWHRLTEDEPLFDAANLIRLNSVVLFLVSSTGNLAASRELTELLKMNAIVEVTDAYRSSHLDSTILPLNENLVLVNSARVSPRTLPNCLAEKEIIYFDQVAPLPEGEVLFHQQVRRPAAERIQDLGFDSTLHEVSSPWAGLNVLSVSPELVLVESRQTELIMELRARGMEVETVRMRHPYSMLGGLHCTTLDLWRED